MSLNISEANALNRVITHLAGLRQSGTNEPIVTREQAIDALALLAHGANKALKAGYTQTSAHATLTEHWPEEEGIYRWAEITAQHVGHTTIPLTGVLGHEAVLVLEGDQSGQLARMLVDDQPERHQPLTDEPCGVIPTPRGRQLVNDYRAHRTLQHPRSAD